MSRGTSGGVRVRGSRGAVWTAKRGVPCGRTTFLEGDDAVVRHEVGVLRDAWYGRD